MTVEQQHIQEWWSKKCDEDNIIDPSFEDFEKR